VNTAADVVGSLLSGTPSIHVTLSGDTLSGLAALYLGDAARWRDIALANNLDDPFDLAPGTPLVIPSSAAGQPVGPGRGQP
jgi:nucleoid-associated protein YgaU